MGTYIHGRFEKKKRNGGFEVIDYSDALDFFNFHSYFIFGWLADVRNYSAVPPLEFKEAYFKNDYGERELGFTLDSNTLLDFDYDQIVEDRRGRVREDGTVDCRDSCPPGKGVSATYREHLGEGWFERLEILRNSCADRIVFWFD